MSSDIQRGNQQVRRITSLVASILVGLTLLIAGSGKAFGFGEIPGQTMEFIGMIFPDALLTPEVAYFIGDIFLQYIIPWAELSLGILLILHIWPRLVAALCLPLTLAFMANNSWMIHEGLEEYPECPCFGIWETILGPVSPLQSLCIDIGLLALALTIIFVHPGGFLSSPPWLAKLGKGT